MAKLRAARVDLNQDGDSPHASPDVTVAKHGRAGLIVIGLRGLGLEGRPALGQGLAQLGGDPGTYCAVFEAKSWIAPRIDAAAPSSSLAVAYQGLWALDRFPKPHVTLLHGDVTWPGLALALCGTHRVADPRATFALGPIPDSGPLGWGASYRLASLPRALGVYLAVTGAPFDSALAYRCGWLTQRISGDRSGLIKERLILGDPIDALLDGLDEGPAISSLDPYLSTIEQCFAASTLEAALANLDAISGAAASWARQTAASLRSQPQTPLARAYRQLSQTPPLPSLRDALLADYAATLQAAGQSERTGLDLPDVRPPSID